MTVGTITFDTPALLVLAAVLPPLAWWLLRRRELTRLLRLQRFARPAAWPRLGIAPRSLRGPLLRVGAAMLLLGIAAAGPRWGVAPTTEIARGIDYAIAIDASLSMLARDERGDRLTRALQTVRRLRAAAPADRVALLAFAGRSYILTPLTSDDGALALYLENLTPDVVGQAGSSLARAIRQGSELLAASDGSADRALLVLSDGEAFEPEADVRAAAEEAAAQGVLLVTVGFGTTDGTTIPIPDGRGGETVKRDEQGAVVTTRYEPALLEAAATAADGVFVPADAPDRAGQVRAALARLQGERRTVEGRAQGVPRYAWFAAPALLLLLLDMWRRAPRRARAPWAAAESPSVSGARALRDARGATASAPAARIAATTAAGILTLLAGCTRVPDPAEQLANGDAVSAVLAYADLIRAGDTTQRTRYNLGTALLGLDSLAAAQSLLEPVRRGADGELRTRARFNEGWAALVAGRRPTGPTFGPAAEDSAQARAASLAAARALYRAALVERPEDVDAKWNYELALRPEPPQGGGGGGGGGDDEPNEAPPQPGELDPRQAQALLDAAAREEQDVQGRRQRTVRRPPPPGGKDW